MTHVPLLDRWWLAPTTPGEVPAAVAATRVPATVPGCVHTDLLAAGLIRDPYRDGEEEALAWIGRTDWVYQRTFPWHNDGELPAESTTIHITGGSSGLDPATLTAPPVLRCVNDRINTSQDR